MATTRASGRATWAPSAAGVGKAHRRVIGRREKLGAVVRGELGRREQGVAHVGDHDRAVVELLVQPPDEPRDRDGRVRLERERLAVPLRGRRRLGPSSLEAALH